jgi:hypothetical protein
VDLASTAENNNMIAPRFPIPESINAMYMLVKGKTSS